MIMLTKTNKIFKKYNNKFHNNNIQHNTTQNKRTVTPTAPRMINTGVNKEKFIT